MKYYKNKENIELDDMNIKSHLNNSLDLSGICISEDLINKTLAAINQQTVNDQESINDRKEYSKVDSKRVITWNRYVRGFAGVAAAALIITTGYTLIKQIQPKSFSKDSANSSAIEESIMMEDAKESAYSSTGTSDTMDMPETTMENAAKADKNAAFEEKSEAQDEGAVQFRITADVDDTSVQDDAAISSVVEENESIGTTDDNNAGMQASEVVMLTFGDIFISEPEQAQYISITDFNNNSSITLTEQAEILQFYAIMEKHQFIADIESSVEQSYMVEAKKLQTEEEYTLLVGENITIKYQEGENVSSSSYSVVDPELFKKNLVEVIQSIQ